MTAEPEVFHMTDGSVSSLSGARYALITANGTVTPGACLGTYSNGTTVEYTAATSPPTLTIAFDTTTLSPVGDLGTGGSVNVTAK